MQKVGIVINNIKDIEKLNTSNFDYIELSDNGFTPSLQMFEAIKAQYNVPIHCMIKHQSSLYNLETIEEICNSAKTLIANGADALVCDFMNSDYSINYMLVSKLRRCVKDKALIFHLTLGKNCDVLSIIQELIVIEVEKVVFKGDIDQYLKNITRIYYDYQEVIEMILESDNYETLIRASEYTSINNIQYHIGNTKIKTED